jgi:hypothetical protein
MENQNELNELSQQPAEIQSEKQDVVIEVVGWTLFGNPQQEMK